MPRTLREKGAAAVSLAGISYAFFLLLRHLSLEVKLLALSLLWFSMFLLQRVLVGKRRCSDHWFVQYGAMAAYYLPTPIAISAASALYYSKINEPEIISLFMFGVFIMFHTTKYTSISSPRIFTNMRIYSLRDRPLARYTLLKWSLFLFFGKLEWASISMQSKTLGLGLLLWVSMLKQPTEEFTLDFKTKAVADYMKRLKLRSSKSSGSPFFENDANSNSNSSLQLDCCRYPFVQGEKGEWVTVKDLFRRCDDLSSRDKDTCLSYSLSRLLARRYYGFHCAEEGDNMVRRLALADLGTTDGYKRAFTIVEVQLAFLHDYFFTASFPNVRSGSSDGEPWLAAYDVVLIFFCSSITKIQTSVLSFIILHGLAAVVSSFMLCGLVFGFPHQDHLAIYWRPIHTAFRKLGYIPERSFGHLLARLFRSVFSPNAPDVLDPFQTQASGPYWSNKIGQYSILQDFNRHPSLKKELVTWFQRTMLSQPSDEFIKHLPVEEEEVDMKKRDNVRKLVANTLRAIDGPPTNGTRSLKINMDTSEYDWSWTCRQETHTRTILIWHIATCYCATCYCGMTPPQSYRPDGLPRLVEIDNWYEIATALSRYCAYLVAFLPEFLPDQDRKQLTTKEVFQNVIQDAQRELGSTYTEEKEKHTKLRGLRLPPRRRQTTFHKGVRLGRQLEKLNTRLRWKVMAEFWAETILYIAPSDNTDVAEAHIEHLAKGGEFITHIWAMLSNAGILKRATGEWHPPPASTTKRQTSELAPNGEQSEIMEDI